MPSFTTPLTALRAVTKIPCRISARSSPSFLLRQQQQHYQQPHHQISPYLSKLFYSSQATPSPSNPPPSSSSPPSNTSRPLTNRTSSSSHKSATPNFSHRPKRAPRPEYKITFTCDPCSTRSSHLISKQGYHRGSVLISCPECKNRHVISDHLGIFGDRSITIEDLMKERGQLVKKGTLSEEGGDIEFWQDESVEQEATDVSKP